MLSCHGKRGTACGFCAGRDDSSSVSRNVFVEGGKCTDQQVNWQVDFSHTSNSKSASSVYSSTTYKSQIVSFWESE